jgi:hypothetical protein
VNKVLFIFVAVLINCMQGCSTLPQSMHANENDTQRIVWAKGSDAQAFRDQHGVCHMFARDTKAAFQVLGEQVKACFNGSLPEKSESMPLPARSVKVAWNKVSRAQMPGVYADATGQGTVKGKGGGWRSADRLFAVRGFFMQAGDTCHVVVPDQADYVSTLGHEFKHCVDGYFHDNLGQWHEHERSAEVPARTPG